MTDYEPITTELRGAVKRAETIDGTPMVTCGADEFERLCDNIDAVDCHLAKEADGNLVISRVTIEVRPHIDWLRMARELREYATVSWDPWPGARNKLYQMCDAILQWTAIEGERNLWLNCSSTTDLTPEQAIAAALVRVERHNRERGRYGRAN